MLGLTHLGGFYDPVHFFVVDSVINKLGGQRIVNLFEVVDNHK